VDSSKLNLKAVLLHNGKVLSSITFLRAINKNESRKHENSSDLYKLQGIPMAPSWRLQDCCYIYRTVAELHAACVKGEVEQRMSNTRRGTGLPDGHWSREQRRYSTYSWKNPAIHCCLLCTSTNEESVKAMDQTGSAFRQLAEKFSRNHCCKNQRGLFTSV
jgi:hypothetical protein